MHSQREKDLSIVEGAQSLIQQSSQSQTHTTDLIHSNQWYSSLYKSFPTNPLYTFPLSFKFTKNGIEVSYPKPDYKEKTIFATHKQDFVIGFGKEFQKPSIESIGDWNIRLQSKTTGANIIDSFFGHGFPFIKLEQKGSDPLIITSNNVKVFTANGEEIKQKEVMLESAIIETDSTLYGLHFDKKVQLTVTNNSLVFASPKKAVAALLTKKTDLALFKNLINTEIESTNVSYTLTDNFLNTTFSIKTNNNSDIPIALYPHQYDFLEGSHNQGVEYQTLRGTLNLIQANSFTTSTTSRIPSDKFARVKTNEKTIIEQLKKDVEEFAKAKPPESKNYYLGTWLGQGASLIQMADAYGLSSEKDNIIKKIKPVFDDSLTYYKYDENTSSLVSTKPEFGNEELNDHHFHYGYFIRTASILKNNNNISRKSEEVIKMMVKDIATIEKNSPDFPYIRNFDAYESHSWADGYADSNDGGNQESSSEAMNAWYSIYLWSKATKDTSLEKAALYLFNSELNAISYYWFDDHDIYPEDYKHELASIVWGGKVDFSTWFSGKANMIYGIQLLPITPASDYLLSIINFDKYNEDFLSSGGTINDEWGDLYLIWKSFHKDVNIHNIPANIKSHDRTPRSLLIYMISKNLETE